MTKFDTLLEALLKHTADQTIYINPNHKEMMVCHKNSSRGTMVWDMAQSGKWYMTDGDYTHNTLAARIPLDHDLIHFYAYPQHKEMSLGFNYVDYRKEEARGSYVPYKALSENPYWKILEDDGWTLRDTSGSFDAKGLQERIQNHPLDVKNKELDKESDDRIKAFLNKQDQDLLKKLGVE